MGNRYIITSNSHLGKWFPLGNLGKALGDLTPHHARFYGLFSPLKKAGPAEKRGFFSFSWAGADKKVKIAQEKTRDKPIKTRENERM